MENKTKYERALKHVRELKEFYQHLFVWIIFCIFWIFFSDQIIDFVVSKTEHTESKFFKWLNLNVALVPVLWGIAVAIQALYVFRLKFTLIRKWEEQKIAEYLEDEKEELKGTQEWE